MRVVKNSELRELPIAPPPVEKPSLYIRCDRDWGCDYAKFEIVTLNGSVFLCGHHYHVNEPFLTTSKHEVKRLNA